MSPEFCELCFWCLEKHSQTETSFKTNFLPVKGDSSLTSCCVVHNSENKMVSQRNVSCPEAVDRLSCLVAAKVDRLSCLVAAYRGSWWQRIGARYEYVSILKFFLTTQLSCSWPQYNFGIGEVPNTELSGMKWGFNNLNCDTSTLISEASLDRMSCHLTKTLTNKQTGTYQ